LVNGHSGFLFPPIELDILYTGLRTEPDFVCHFHLFKAMIDYSSLDNGWSVDEELCEVISRTPVAVKSNLDFLRKSALLDHSANKELQRFGFSWNPVAASSPVKDPMNPSTNSGEDSISATLLFGNTPMISQPIIPEVAKEMTISFGSFQSAITTLPKQRNWTFKGNSFLPRNWDHIPNFMLFHILDQRRFGYSDDEIANIWKLASIPPSEVIFQRLNLCAGCGQLGHQEINCMADTDMDCQVAPPKRIVLAHLLLPAHVILVWILAHGIAIYASLVITPFMLARPELYVLGVTFWVT
jgi:hypothetical protein